ncbi:MULTISPECIES: hypothetical protein [Amycolatopsis]|uniref:Uncharacterized protein n=1 Tax=Amycolatopsis bullii TaxID=941987 RepID=A0ABQ3K4H8_9PSEU|nr:hypothetical protein [Amycolatopsis bullii]GHF98823.1 hypothetical protein GCM10017567_12030 [Amycolatopsis bullii]
MPVEFLTDEQAESYRTFRVEPTRPKLERLRRPRTRSTETAMARALDRVNEISGFGLGRVDVSRVPVNRLSTLARYGMASKAAALERAPEPRRMALVAAVCGTWRRPRSTTRWIRSRC